jgi:hypothetical protein
MSSSDLRVIVLQAVEHAQKDPANPFKSFVRVLRDDQERVIKLESELAELKLSSSRIRLDRSHGVMDFTFSIGEVDQLLRTGYLVREVGDDSKMLKNALPPRRTPQVGGFGHFPKLRLSCFVRA